MKNRYGDEYWFEKVKDNIYTIKGDLAHWRLGGKEGAELNMDDLGFVDPSGGPFIHIGYKIKGRKVKRIFSEPEGMMFEVE